MGRKALEKIKIKVPFLVANKNLIEKLFEKRPGQNRCARLSNLFQAERHS